MPHPLAALAIAAATGLAVSVAYLVVAGRELARLDAGEYARTRRTAR
jgi:hypothetical protein